MAKMQVWLDKKNTPSGEWYKNVSRSLDAASNFTFSAIYEHDKMNFKCSEVGDEFTYVDIQGWVFSTK